MNTPRVDKRPRLDVLKVLWYSKHSADEFAFMDAVLNVLRDELPAALPSTYESDQGVEPFAWEERFLFRDAARRGYLSWRPSPPFLDGSLIGVRSRLQQKGPPFVSLGLYVDALAFDDQDFERSFFTAVGHLGRISGSFYAVGILARDLVMVDGKVSGTLGSSTPRLHVMDNKRWLGLPWDGVSFEWFGPAYVPLLGDRANDVGWQIGGGILLQYASKRERFAVLPVGLLESFPDGGPATVVPPELC